MLCMQLPECQIFFAVVDTICPNLDLDADTITALLRCLNQLQSFAACVKTVLLAPEALACTALKAALVQLQACEFSAVTERVAEANSFYVTVAGYTSDQLISINSGATDLGRGFYQIDIPIDLG